MAGKIAKYNSISSGISAFDLKHQTAEASLSGVNVMDEYLSNQLGESDLLDLLLDEETRTEALLYLDKKFHENNSILIFKDKHALFKGFAQALGDVATGIRVQCTKLVAKIVPQLGSDLDVCMSPVLQKIVSNVGDQNVSLQKESIQTLHLYMKHSIDVFPILSVIANHGIQHRNLRTRQQIIHKFPTLLFSDFKHEDFFDVVNCLVINLTESNIDKDLVLKTIEKVKEFIGPQVFNGYINRLSEPMQETFLKMTATPDINSQYQSSLVKEDRVTPRKADAITTAMERLSSNDDLENFGKSGYFDMMSFNRKAVDHHSSRMSGLGNSNNSRSDLPIVSDAIMNGLVSNDIPQQVHAIKELITTINEFHSTQPLKQNLRFLVSLLVPMIENHNQRIILNALDAIDRLVVRLGPDVRDSIKSICNSVSKKFGTTKLPIKGKCMRLLMHAMEATKPQMVLDYFLPLLDHKQARVRHDCMNLIICSLLHFSLGKEEQNKLNIDRISASVAPLLVDPNKDVRRGTLECFAVIHKVNGSETRLGPISDAVNQVELMNDNATGLMSAMHARLFRKSLPRVTEHFLVDYPDFSTASAPISSPQGADLQWVKAAEDVKPRSGSILKTSYSVSESTYVEKSNHNNNGRSFEAPVAENSPTTTTTRRFLSAGKQRFPWASPTDESSKHPSSAPVKTQREKDKQPPFQPRHTWGAESDIPTQFISASSQINHRNKLGQTDNQSTGNGPSYQELYMKKKSHSQKASPVRTTTNLGANSSYKPSFASSGPSVSPESKPEGSEASFLSASCPTTFFENSGPRHSTRRIQPKMAYGSNDGNSSVISTEGIAVLPDTPIHLKATLARSASKRREAINESRKENKIADENVVPMKLKNSSASPRLDRLSTMSVDKVRPILKQNRNPNNSFSGIEKISHSSFTELADHNGSFTSGYTPSGLQDKPEQGFKNVPEKPLYRPSNPEAHKTRSPLTNGNNNSNKPPRREDIRSVTDVCPIVASESSPARHRHKEPAPHTAPDKLEQNENVVNEGKLSVIRRSAQNKLRQRMRSQPTDDQSSPLDLGNSDILDLSMSSPVPSTDVDYSFPNPSKQSSITSIESPAKSEPPPFQYNPNMGVTFDPKKVDSTVSVVGVKVGYAIPVHGSSSNPDMKISPVTTPTNLAPSSSKSTPVGPTARDRRRSHRGPTSPLGMASTVSISGSNNNPFNVQGKGVFMSPSTSQLLSASEQSGSSSPVHNDNHAWSSSSNDSDPNRLMGGIFGRAVRNPSASSEENSPHDPFATISNFSLSASLRQRQLEKKEKSSSSSRKNSDMLSPLDGVADEYKAVPVSRKLDTTVEPRTKSGTSPFDLNISGTTQTSGLSKERVNKTPASSVSSVKLANEKLDNPEQSLVNAISMVESTDPENWAVITDNIFIIRRMAKFHPAVLASKIHDVMLLLCKNVHNLRSQVCRASVVCIADIFDNLKRANVNSDVEICVKGLLKEYGGANSFIQEEIVKALQSIMESASSNKTLNALLNSGVRHKNKSVRNITAQMCAELVDKMGPGKALSGVKDTTDRLLDAVSQFIVDSSPGVRYHGRYIINALMYHGDFEKCVEKFLSPQSAQLVKECVSNVKQRGVGSTSAAGSRKMQSGGVRRSGSTPSSGQSKERINFSNSTTSASFRRKPNTGTKVFNEQEAEEVSRLCSNLKQGTLLDRKEAANNLVQKVIDNRAFVEDNITKIMDAYMTLLTTANTKLNAIGLTVLPDIVLPLGDTIRDKLPELVPAVLKLIASKQQSTQAKAAVDTIVGRYDNMVLIQPFAQVSQYGAGKSRQVAIAKLVELLENFPPKRVQYVERHVLPLLWSLLSPNGAPSGVQLRREIQSLAVALRQLIGPRLFDYAETQNLSRSLETCLKSELT